MHIAIERFNARGIFTLASIFDWNQFKLAVRSLQENIALLVRTVMTYAWPTCLVNLRNWLLEVKPPITKQEIKSHLPASAMSVANRK